MRTALLAALLLGCPGESATEAYSRGQEDLRREQHEQYACRDGEVYPSHNGIITFDGTGTTHLCVHGYWIAVAAERRADLPRSPCEPPYCMTFRTTGPTR